MPTPRASTRPGRRSRRAAQALGAAIIGLTSLAVVPTFASAAHAMPRCDVADPPPICDRGPTDPPPPPTTPPTPKPWTGTVNVADLSESRHSTALTAGYWARAGLSAWRVGSYPVAWSSPAATTGKITIPNSTTSGSSFAFTLEEAAEQGPLCRSNAVAALGSTGTITVITAPNLTQTAAALAALTPTISGAPSSPLPTTISSVTVTPANGVINVRVRGSVTVTTATFKAVSGIDTLVPWSATIDFDETVPLTVTPHASPDDTSKVVDITSPSPAPISLNIRNVWGPISNLVTGFFQTTFEQMVRTTVANQAGSSINQAILARPEVTAFTGLGYTLSFRRIAVSPSGVILLPAVCKLT